MPSTAHDIMVTYGAQLTSESVKVGDTFRIFTNLPGKFRYRFTNGRPFQSTDPDFVDHQSGEEREATRVGVFPFRCFVNDVEIGASPDGSNLAGEIVVTEG